MHTCRMTQASRAVVAAHRFQVILIAGIADAVMPIHLESPADVDAPLVGPRVAASVLCQRNGASAETVRCLRAARHCSTAEPEVATDPDVARSALTTIGARIRHVNALAPHPRTTL